MKREFLLLNINYFTIRNYNLLFKLFIDSCIRLYIITLISSKLDPISQRIKAKTNIHLTISKTTANTIDLNS